MKSLLRLNPEDRLSAAECLEHPWINCNHSEGYIYLMIMFLLDFHPLSALRK